MNSRAISRNFSREYFYIRLKPETEFFETVTQSSLKTVNELVSEFKINAIVAPLTININNINGDNYENGAANRSLGKGNTFNAPIYMGDNYNDNATNRGAGRGNIYNDTVSFTAVLSRLSSTCL